ncbi:hypothetical protein [Rhizobium alvei]|uniref:Lipoprotein n=1 Tax=Rhizobium alvei TaxID=1132659 RepID=A0ABT8YKM2_9HYPH|nr:hypothetical protein [Rhizobium alvei]MDO6964212.1 hypothetical protein [Rhizobium alvei]
MLRIRHLVAILALTVLGACNSTDALTPQAEIPGQDTKAEKQVTENQPVAPAREPVSLAEDNATLGEDPPTNSLPPQNTFEAQAQALERGEPNPSATPPEDNGGLGANLYKTTETKPSSSIYSTNRIAAQGTIRFLPIIGAPVQAVTPLSRELGNAARSNGLTIKSSGDHSAQHVLKGYLSAFVDGKNVTVTYVWDVLDDAGNRLHRIQGQESVPASGDDPWSAIPAELMQGIGVTTIAEYMKWKSSAG